MIPEEITPPLSSVPIDSPRSPERIVGRRAWLCHNDCARCVCPRIVALAFAGRTDNASNYTEGELPTDIKALILETRSRVWQNTLSHWDEDGCWHVILDHWVPPKLQEAHDDEL